MSVPIPNQYKKDSMKKKVHTNIRLLVKNRLLIQKNMRLLLSIGPAILPLRKLLHISRMSIHM